MNISAELVQCLIIKVSSNGFKVAIAKTYVLNELRFTRSWLYLEAFCYVQNFNRLWEAEDEF